MEPIINPMVFYWIGVLPSIFVISFIASFTLILLIALLIIDFDSGNLELRKAFPKIRLFWLSVLLVFFGVVAVFIPTKSTAYKMLAADKLTEDRLEKVIDYIDEKAHTLLKQVTDKINREDK